MFGRKKKAASSEASTEQGTTTQAGAEATGPLTGGPSTDGPHDSDDVTEVDHLVDLGSLLIAPAREGIELRVEVDQESNEVTAVQLGDDHGAVQLQVFAAPRSAGIWGDIRDEISEMISGSGGTVEVVSGPFGDELRSRLAQPGPQGRTVFAPAVFAGVDGPRWFLRAVYSGSAAVDDAARADLDDIVRSAVVVRGDDPRAPREMLPLKMPVARQPRSQAPTEPEGPVDDLKPFERGPEITEVR